MGKKEVVPIKEMVGKLKAALAARKSADTFILARTDSLQPEGLDAALRRGEKYLKAGADGVYVEGPTSVEELKQVGKAFKGQELATSVLENGGKTPWLPPEEFADMGFTMILYPTTILFQAARAIRRAAETLRAGKPMYEREAVDMETFEKIVELEHWQEVEKQFRP